MREYELTVIFDLSLAESGGPDAAVEQITSLVTSRGGKLLKTDHWGRRRMAYPINHAIDGDYVISRVELDPSAVSPLEAALTINERVYRHLIVRADELPVPAPPREPRIPQAERTETPEETPAVNETPAPETQEAPAAEAVPAEPESEPETATQEPTTETE